MKERIAPLTITLLAALLVASLAFAQTAPEAPAPAPPAAPTSPGGAGGAEAERETIQPLPPAPAKETTTTTIPYTLTDCVPLSDKPAIKVVPQRGVTRPSLDGTLADYAFPEANQARYTHSAHNYWTATILFEIENGKCLREDSAFHMLHQSPTSPQHAGWQDVSFTQTRGYFTGGGYFAEMHLRIYNNDDDAQHRQANSSTPQYNSAHLIGGRPQCVEWVRLVPALKANLVGNDLREQNNFGGIDTVLIAITGNMPDCPDRY